jgi:signal transduction histidine kinase/CheY-like chemotaxis protein/HPt (histidine-containing phosphotransfer) domain-containing protein
MDLQNAGNSVRIFMLTHDHADIEPYYGIISTIDSKINHLRANCLQNPLLVRQIDTISRYIEENIVVWNELIAMQHNDSVEYTLQGLIDRLSNESMSNSESILKRVFGRRAQYDQQQSEILEDLNKMEEQENLLNRRLQEKEFLLGLTSNQIRSRFYTLIATLEAEVSAEIERNATAADAMAKKTYNWLAVFSVCGTLLVMLVLITVVRFVRKTREYQRALEISKEESLKLARTREMFVANMSHEIRTPVTAIYGYAEQLLLEKADDKRMKTIGIIKSSADHLVKVLNDVLDFSKLQNDMIKLEKIPFSMRTVMEEVQLLLEKQASLHGNKLTCFTDPNVPDILLGDPYRLRQILINLAGNAVKFTANGEISMHANCTELKGDQALLLLTVADTGIGIEKDKLETVFEEFTQADNATTRHYGGTGLGLSIVKKLVELHGGNISIESERNKGTVVSCRLAFAAGDPGSLPDSPARLQVPEFIKKLNVLIVDDEEYIRLLYKTIFDRWGLNYREAVTGVQAIELIKGYRPDMIIMDMRMPLMDGRNTIHFIRNGLKINQTELPVIGVSAIQSADESDELHLAGMNAFMHKPFNEKMLLDTMLSVLGCKPGGTGEGSRYEKFDAPVSRDEINLMPLYRLADHDTGFVKQLLERFIESTDSGLRELHDTVLSGNIVQTAETAHRISSPCRHVGAGQLFEYLHTIEMKARSGADPDVLIALSIDSRKEFETIRGILNAHLDKIV